MDTLLNSVLNTTMSTSTPAQSGYLSSITSGLVVNTLNTSGSITISNGTPFANITGTNVESGFRCRGDAVFEGDVRIKGKSLGDALSTIEERLAILHPNKELEEKWENLRGLRKAYMELEAEIIEKEKIWSILKG